MGIELLNRITKIFKDYCGVLSEESIRSNFVLCYELLDEIIDFGYIQSTSTEQLKAFVFNAPVEVKGGQVLIVVIIILNELKMFVAIVEMNNEGRWRCCGCRVRAQSSFFSGCSWQKNHLKVMCLVDLSTQISFVAPL